MVVNKDGKLVGIITRQNLREQNLNKVLSSKERRGADLSSVRTTTTTAGLHMEGDVELTTGLQEQGDVELSWSADEVGRGGKCQIPVIGKNIH